MSLHHFPHILPCICMLLSRQPPVKKQSCQGTAGKTRTHSLPCIPLPSMENMVRLQAQCSLHIHKYPEVRWRTSSTRLHVHMHTLHTHPLSLPHTHTHAHAFSSTYTWTHALVFQQQTLAKERGDITHITQLNKEFTGVAVADTCHEGTL